MDWGGSDGGGGKEEGVQGVRAARHHISPHLHSNFKYILGCATTRQVEKMGETGGGRMGRQEGVWEDGRMGGGEAVWEDGKTRGCVGEWEDGMFAREQQGQGGAPEAGGCCVRPPP